MIMRSLLFWDVLGLGKSSIQEMGMAFFFKQDWMRHPAWLGLRPQEMEIEDAETAPATGLLGVQTGVWLWGTREEIKYQQLYFYGGSWEMR